jgi:hypothetical protein
MRLEVLPQAGRYARLTPDPRALARNVARELPLLGRHTNRYPVARRDVDPSIRVAIEDMTEGECSVRALTSPSERRSVRDWIAAGTRARYHDRALHEALMAALRLGPEDGSANDGLALETLALPAGAKHLLRLVRPWRRMRLANAVGFGHLMASMERRNAAAPLYFAITGSQTPRATMDAGRLMERAWIALCSAGLAVQPYYVVTAQLLRLARAEAGPFTETLGGVADEVDRTFDGAGLHILLKVGVPTRSAVRSKRRPLGEIMNIECSFKEA